MDTKSWQLPVHRIPTKEKADRSVVWNNVHLCYEQTLFGQVTCAQYNHEGSKLGCVSTNQVLLLRVPHSEGAVWNEQTSRRSNSLRFRDDDKLAVQSIEQRVVVRSTDTAFERSMQGHTRDVRDAIFIGKQCVASCSDDTSVRVWDLIAQSEIGAGRAHTDYVRSMAFHSEGCFYSGSYDRRILLWDVRSAMSGPSATLRPSEDDQGPVEQICYVPSRHWLIASVVDVVLVFDVRTNQVLVRGSEHTKAVTALAYSDAHKSIVTGSLDHRVKFWSADGDASMTCVSTQKFPHPVTAVGVHPESSEYAVGMGNGLVNVFKVASGSDVARHRTEAQAHEKLLLFGEEAKLSAAERKEQALQRAVARVRQLLVVYQYHKSLKSALYSRQPDVILSTLEELQRRGALHVALSGHTDRTIVQLLRFVIERLDTSTSTDLMLVVLDLIFAIYGEVAGQSVFFHKELMKAYHRLGDTLKAMRSMQSTIGIMEYIVDEGTP